MNFFFHHFIEFERKITRKKGWGSNNQADFQVVGDWIGKVGHRPVVLPSLLFIHEKDDKYDHF